MFLEPGRQLDLIKIGVLPVTETSLNYKFTKAYQNDLR